MSGLFASLNQSVKALNAQSRGVETAGRNLANVNNADYARQRVLFGDRGTVLTPQGAESLGIEAKAIQQIRDSLIDQQVGREIARTASLQSQSDAYAKAQAALGESIDRTETTGDTASSGEGLSGAFGEFFNALQAFAARPTDLGERQNLVQRADILAERFRVTDSRLEQIQTDLGTQVQSDTDDVNRLLSTVADLNGQIGRLEINAVGSAVDLRDQRQATIEKLAAKIGSETRPNATETGQLDVFVRDAGGNPVVLVSLAVVANPVAFDGAQLTAGTAATPVALSSGSINGLLTARDGAVQDLRDQLDDFASQLAVSVNAAYNPTGATGDFFAYNPAAPASTLALAAGLTPVSLKASDGGASADNTLAAAVAALSAHPFSIGSGDLIDGTFSQYYSGVVSDFGRTVSGTDGRLADQTNIENLVRQQRQSVSGVSMDEEMADLLKYQRAFEASSKVISIIDGLLDVVVNRLIR
ncbi:MAG: flagellar hook-associated protein FlgK [Opitutaceae bacterium]|jgi:flagellar hook-associated protein 1 FlgK